MRLIVNAAILTGDDNGITRCHFFRGDYTRSLIVRAAPAQRWLVLVTTFVTRSVLLWRGSAFNVRHVGQQWFVLSLFKPLADMPNRKGQRFHTCWWNKSDDVYRLILILN